MDKSFIRGEFSKQYPGERRVQAIKEYAPEYDLGLDLFMATEKAIERWWEAQPLEDRVCLQSAYRRGEWM